MIPYSSLSQDCDFFFVFFPNVEDDCSCNTAAVCVRPVHS